MGKKRNHDVIEEPEPPKPPKEEKKTRVANFSELSLDSLLDREVELANELRARQQEITDKRRQQPLMYGNSEARQMNIRRLRAEYAHAEVQREIQRRFRTMEQAGGAAGTAGRSSRRRGDGDVAEAVDAPAQSMDVPTFERSVVDATPQLAPQVAQQVAPQVAPQLAPLPAATMPSGMSLGMPLGMPPGMSPSIPCGISPGMPSGFACSMSPAMPQGIPTGFPSGMSPGMQMGIPSGMSLSMPPGIPSGMPPGMLPGMPAGMMPTLPGDMSSSFGLAGMPAMPSGMATACPVNAMPGMPGMWPQLGATAESTMAVPAAFRRSMPAAANMCGSVGLLPCSTTVSGDTGVPLAFLQMQGQARGLPW